jgi:hypothetical protein
MRFALKVPIIRHAIDIYGAGIAWGVRHIVGTSMPTVPKHRCGFMPKAQAVPARADRPDHGAPSALLRHPAIVD